MATRTRGTLADLNLPTIKLNPGRVAEPGISNRLGTAAFLTRRHGKSLDFLILGRTLSDTHSLAYFSSGGQLLVAARVKDN